MRRHTEVTHMRDRFRSLTATLIRAWVRAWKSLVDFRYKSLSRHFRTLVASIGLALRQLDFNRPQITIRDSRQQMGDAVEPGPLLVVGVYDVPRTHLSIRFGEHKVLGPRIVDPMLT